MLNPKSTSENRKWKITRDRGYLAFFARRALGGVIAELLPRLARRDTERLFDRGRIVRIETPRSA